MQLMPSPKYPLLHSHILLPIEFVHCAFDEHPPLFVEHSFISIFKKIRKRMK